MRTAVFGAILLVCLAAPAPTRRAGATAAFAEPFGTNRAAPYRV